MVDRIYDPADGNWCHTTSYSVVDFYVYDAKAYFSSGTFGHYGIEKIREKGISRDSELFRIGLVPFCEGYECKSMDGNASVASF